MTRIALAYFAILAVIVLAADTGWLPHFAQQLHDLPFGDKALHFTMFGLLALAANLALASCGRRSLVRAIVIGSIFVVIVATIEEYSNHFLSRRDWSLGDLTANYLGVVCLGMLPAWCPQLFAISAGGVENDSPAPHVTGSR